MHNLLHFFHLDLIVVVIATTRRCIEGESKHGGRKQQWKSIYKDPMRRFLDLFLLLLIT
jgi:hypothetical protein